MFFLIEGFGQSPYPYQLPYFHPPQGNPSALQHYQGPQVAYMTSSVGLPAVQQPAKVNVPHSKDSGGIPLLEAITGLKYGANHDQVT